MSFHLTDLLSQVHQLAHLGWVVAVITRTRGHCYRKQGTIMFVNELGQYYGMISGGCLESDIVQQSRRVFASQNRSVVRYDFSEESEESWQLGLGCGGMVEVTLFPADETLMQSLACLLREVGQHRTCYWQFDFSGDATQTALFNERGYTLMHDDTQMQVAASPSLASQKHKPDTLLVKVLPKAHFLVVGSGADVVPVAKLAQSIGWLVTVMDDRVLPRLGASLPGVTIKQGGEHDVIDAVLMSGHFTAGVVMTHNMTRDAKYLALLLKLPLLFLGLLGPTSRSDKVYTLAGLSASQIARISNPVGLELGGELPESIALSIVAECHAVLNAGKLSGCLDKLQKLQVSRLNQEHASQHGNDAVQTSEQSEMAL